MHSQTQLHTFQYWLRGIRLYIATGSLLVTGLVIWWAHSAYAGTTLYPSRVEESFAWLATGLLILAISIGPYLKLFPDTPSKRLLADSRRMIGISAAWFATLHAAIAYLSQFKAANPLALPTLYQRSFVFGAIAFVILLAMVATSFDAAFIHLGKWWFRLHRLVYVAVIAVLIHAFLTGVHATQSTTLLVLTAVAALFMLLYGLLWYRQKLTTRMQQVSAVVMAIAVVVTLSFGLSQHNLQARTSQMTQNRQR